MEGIVDDRPDLRVRKRGRTPGSGSVLLDAGEAKAPESAPPESTGVTLGVQLGHDLFVLESVGGAEDDPGPEHDAKGGGPISSPGLEPTTLFGGERDRWSDPHRGRKGSPATDYPFIGRDTPLKEDPPADALSMAPVDWPVWAPDSWPLVDKA